ncbi:hypothetical protein C4552_02805 [Candidatus Parcubacteria bacterium]|nr:MAG: hypothetical protein C4552_02805 [Candidatus Parcubacteria bacterium]
MLSIIFFIGLLGVAAAFGGLVAVGILGERRVWAVAPIAIIAGFGTLGAAVNAAGFFLPFDAAVWLILGLMALSAAFGWQWLAARQAASLERGDISRHEAFVLFGIALGIAALAGIVALRTLQDSDVKLGHLPLAATIAEGNLPVSDPSAPDHPVAYHYAPEMLSAIFSRVAGTPLWIGYDLQTFLFVFAGLLMAFALARELGFGTHAAVWGAVFFGIGGGLAWLAVVPGIVGLWQTFILGEARDAPWAFLAAMTTPRFDSSFVMASNHTTALGLPVLLVALYAYLRALATGTRWFAFALVAGIAYGYAALALETHVAVLFAAFVAAGIAAGPLGRIWPTRFARAIPGTPGRAIAVTAIILGVGTAMAFWQGGILSTLGQSEEPQAFAFVEDFWNTEITDKGVLPFRPSFFLEFGLPLALFPFAAWRFRGNPRALFIAMIPAIAFLVPLAVRYETRPREMERFFAFSTQLFSFLAGMLLAEIVERSGAWRRFSWRTAAVGVAAFAMGGTALAFLVIYTLTPLGFVGDFSRPFLGIPDAPVPEAARLYAWVRGNSAHTDRFYPFSEEFIRETGRFAPGPFIVGWGYAEELAAYEAFQSACDPNGLRRLGIAYVVARPGVEPMRSDPDCLLRLGAEPVYSDAESPDAWRVWRLSWN